MSSQTSVTEPALSLWSSGSDGICSSRLERVGRDGFLGLAFEWRDGRTVLTERRFTLPLQVLEPMPLEDGSVYLMLLNPTGGLVGGDHLESKITLGPGTHVCLTTPSATKVYRTLGPPVVQETTIRLGEGAVLEYLPDHIIPYPGSVLHQSLVVEMGPESRAILADTFAIGRLARGERWSFKELVNRTTITSQGRPLFLDRTWITPTTQAPAGLGGMEGFGYLATLVFLGDNGKTWENLVQALDNQLNELPSILGGVSPLSRGGCLVRFLAASASDLVQATRCLWTLARQLLLGLPALDLRK